MARTQDARNARTSGACVLASKGERCKGKRIGDIYVTAVCFGHPLGNPLALWIGKVVDAGSNESEQLRSGATETAKGFLSSIGGDDPSFTCRGRRWEKMGRTRR